MAHLLFKQCRSTAQGTGRTRLVEANTSRPGAVAADRFQFGRRHPMQADAGGATRVYVHGHVKWRTVPKRAGAHRRMHCRFAGRLRQPCSACERCRLRGNPAASHLVDALS
jgi:hypothetical protein